LLSRPPFDRATRRGGKTAFERNILPGFARWLLDEIDRRRPDYLVPVESKGARLLETVLRYASDELGSPIPVPVIYGTALAYMDPADLKDVRLMLVDDAVRTGANQQHHRTRAHNYGATDIQAVACIGDGAHEHENVDCYLTVGEELYHEYVWQLTELVAARGLPPEVDHHIFEIRFPYRIAGAWDQLQRHLAELGQLTIDSSERNSDELLPATLHFPRFEGNGDTDQYHVDKIRFFPDLVNNCFYVIPVKFPTIQLPPAKVTEIIPMEEARAQLEQAKLSSPGPAAVLIDEAKTLNAKTLFRAISTGAEFESILGLIRSVWQQFPDASIEPQLDSFEHLYGQNCGHLVASVVKGRLEEVSEPTAGAGAMDAGSLSFRRIYLDEEVIETTKAIVGGLREMYDKRREEPDYDPYERIGRAVSEISEALGNPDPLLISRCIDYGLAMTVLVPFTGYEELDDALVVERKYRVSEIKRGGEPENYDDISDTRVELSEQTVALLCHNLIERCNDGRKAITLSEVALLVAILRPLVFIDHSIPLAVEPRDGSASTNEDDPLEDVPQVLLQKEERPVRLEERASSSTYLDTEGAEGDLKPSPTFTHGYDDDTLAISLRHSVEDVEARVKILLTLLEPLGQEERDLLTRGWAMSTDWRLGLTHVRWPLLSAIEEMESPLRLIRRGSRHEQTIDVADRVFARCAAAERRLDLLGEPWEKPAKERWKSPLKLERVTIESMAVPDKPLNLYQFPAALATLLEALGLMVERIDSVSVAFWRDSDVQGAMETARLAIHVSAEVRQRLTSLSEEEPTLSTLPEDPGPAIQAAAHGLTDATRLLKAFLAAVTGIYRGAQDARISPPPVDKRNSSVLSLDIAGSRQHERQYPQTHREWRSDGLDIAAQWGRAFGGREGKHREGDDLWFEFPVGDSAILAAACVQCQATALGSTQLDPIKREFHAAVDAGELEQGNKGNTQGSCMDRVTGVAKACDAKADTSYVYVTPEAWDHCSAGLRDAHLRDEKWEDEVELDDGTKLKPIAMDSERLLRRYCERLAELAVTIRARVAEQAPVSPSIKTEEEEDAGGQDDGLAAADG